MLQTHKVCCKSFCNSISKYEECFDFNTDKTKDKTFKFGKFLTLKVFLLSVSHNYLSSNNYIHFCESKSRMPKQNKVVAKAITK